MHSNAVFYFQVHVPLFVLFRSSNLDEAGLKTKWQAIDKSTEAASTVNGLAGNGDVAQMVASCTAKLTARFRTRRSGIVSIGFAGGVSPLNGGFLVLSPSMSVFEGLRRLVVSRGPLQPGDKPPLDWDPDLGWGRLIGRQDRLDKYEKDGGKLATGSGWSFNAAWSDQGLLYYYFRFLEMEAGLNVVSRRLGQTKYKTLSYRGGSLLSSTPLGSAGFPELFAHFAGRVKPWNVCGARDEKTLVLAVKKKVKDPSKITREKGRAFWQWHSIYAQLDVDLSIDELSSLMTPGLRC